MIHATATAIPSGELDTPSHVDRDLAMNEQLVRMAWHASTDYGHRYLVETTMGHAQTLIGPRLRARGFAGQQTEAAIGVAVLNRMLVAGRPDYPSRPVAITAWALGHRPPPGRRQRPMPVTLTNPEEIDLVLTGTPAEALNLQRPLADNSLRVVHTRRDPRCRTTCKRPGHLMPSGIWECGLC